MTHLTIESEHDMEVNISYLTELARHKAKARIELSFPSSLLMQTFMVNLCAELDRESIKSSELDLSVFIPKGE